MQYKIYGNVITGVQVEMKKKLQLVVTTQPGISIAPCIAKPPPVSTESDTETETDMDCSQDTAGSTWEPNQESSQEMYDTYMYTYTVNHR